MPGERNQLTEAEAVLRLFGVTKDGNSVSAHCRGFRPYFYVQVLSCPQSSIESWRGGQRALEQEGEGNKAHCSHVEGGFALRLAAVSPLPPVRGQLFPGL